MRDARSPALQAATTAYYSWRTRLINLNRMVPPPNRPWLRRGTLQPNHIWRAARDAARHQRDRWHQVVCELAAAERS